MKLCFSTLGCSERELSQILALASDFNIKALEIRGIGGELNNSKILDFEASRIKDTKEHFNSSGISPVVLGTSCSFHKAENFNAAIVEGRRSIDIAASLNIPYIRVFGNNIIEPREECISRVTEGISTLCNYAEERSVTVLLEVHGDYNTVETLKPLTDSLGKRKSFGLIWDVGHTHAPYGKDYEVFYTEMREFIKHIHIKDKSGDTLTQIGDGDIPLSDILKTLKNNGYQGYISLEWEKRWHPELESIESALKRFTDLLKGLT